MSPRKCACNSRLNKQNSFIIAIKFNLKTTKGKVLVIADKTVTGLLSFTRSLSIKSPHDNQRETKDKETVTVLIKEQVHCSSAKNSAH